MNAINDITRSSHGWRHYQEPADLFESVADSYSLDTRRDQEYYVEVWIEKDAMLGAIAPVCEELDVTYLSTRGYNSLSAMAEAASRFRDKNGVIIHLSDHDPSGLDMTRDLNCRTVGFGADIKRIALTMEQIEQYSLPSNFAKQKDTRLGDYKQIYGDKSWELDALNTKVVADIVRAKIAEYTDQVKRDALILLEQEHKAEIARFVEQYE